MKHKSAAEAGKPDDDWQAQSDADTLMRAEEIKGDKGRHDKAQHHVRKKFHHAARAMKAKGAKRFTARAKLKP